MWPAAIFVGVESARIFCVLGKHSELGLKIERERKDEISSWCLALLNPADLAGNGTGQGFPSLIPNKDREKALGGLGPGEHSVGTNFGSLSFPSLPRSTFLPPAASFSHCPPTISPQTNHGMPQIACPDHTLMTVAAERNPPSLHTLSPDPICERRFGTAPRCASVQQLSIQLAAGRAP